MHVKHEEWNKQTNLGNIFMSYMHGWVREREKFLHGNSEFSQRDFVNCWPSQTLHFLSSKTYREKRQNQLKIQPKNQLKICPV